MAARLLIALIDAYRRRGGGRRMLVECNFEPSCSLYAREAIARHGARRGGRLAWARLRRCRDRERLHPVPDPVPPAGRR
jgi:putative component of membrane protein insertase Oxa1/YidC/SpoIIIJ protein YidD